MLKFVLAIVMMGLGMGKAMAQAELRLFDKKTSQHTGVLFENTLEETTSTSFLYYETFYNGAGVAIGDINNDGLVDVYFGGNQVADRLYLNQGGLTFSDVTMSAGIKDRGGWTTGVTMVDINRDGWLDIYVCKSLYDESERRRNELYINKGDGTFVESAASWKLDHTGYAQHALFFDYDQDEDLDVFLVNQPPNPALLSPLHGKKKDTPEDACRLLRQDNGIFEDVSRAAGVSRRGYALGAVLGDYNQDGLPDIYVTNDYDAPDFLYINAGKGKFRNTVLSSMKHISNFSMGADAGDLDNDGLTDIVVADMVAADNYRLKANMSGMQPHKFWDVVAKGGHHQYMFNTVQLNRGVDDAGTVHFSDVAQLTGMSNTDWSWSPIMEDFDLDGKIDVFISNGIFRDLRFTDALKSTEHYLQRVAQRHGIETFKHYHELASFVQLDSVTQYFPSVALPNYLFKNEGKFQFKNRANQWGLADSLFSVGAAVGDLDNDGDSDLILNNTNGLATIYENQAEAKGQHYLSLSFTKDHALFIDPGISVKVYSGSDIYLRHQHVVRGFHSSSDSRLHFGLGNRPTVDSLEIFVPGQGQTTLYNVEVDRHLHLALDSLKFTTSDRTNDFIFEDRTGASGLYFTHLENDFNDFDRQILLPHKLSQLGPALAVEDFNGDGLSDVFVGGAHLQSAGLYTQLEDGTFTAFNSETLDKDHAYEDLAAAFVDVNNDGWLDIYVASGGNEFSPADPLYEDRLYLNIEGTGLYRSEGVLPKIFESTGTVSPWDYDGDGDTDLLVCGRLVPGKYPQAPRSFLLQNKLIETGELQFVDVTSSACPELSQIGMVTDAIWSDFDGNGTDDFVVVGMWMSPIVFTQQNGKFVVSKDNGLDEYSGWWYTIESHDFDLDGDEDLLIGNLGLNYKYKTSPERPFSVHASDFNEDGTSDIVLGYYQNGKQFPVRGRSCSAQQIPSLAQQIPTYDLFATLDIEQIYGKESLGKSMHLKAHTFATSLFENRGGDFVKRTLPIEVQFSNVNDILITDMNGDGLDDILMVENMMGSEIETPRNDAGLGIVLKGVGEFDFEVVPAHRHGLYLLHEAKGIKEIAKQVYVIANNNQSVQIVKVK